MVNNEEFKKKTMMYQNRILKLNRQPLDYMMSYPKQKSLFEDVNAKTELRRENILKNIVFDIILRVRQIKKQHQLGDFLEKMSQMSTEMKRKYVERLCQTYKIESIAKEPEASVDPKFEHLS